MSKIATPSPSKKFLSWFLHYGYTFVRLARSKQALFEFGEKLGE